MTLDLSLAWYDHPFTVLDFETTGVDALTCGPCSVGAVRFERGQEVARYYTLLKPGCPIPESATAIHGITDEAVEDAPSLADVAPELARIAQNAVPCAYNAAYDRTILHRFIVGQYCPAFDPGQAWLCALVVIRDIDRYVKGQGRHRLDVTCKRWQVPLADAHNALADARASGRLLVQLAEGGAIVRTFPLGKLLEHIERRRIEQDHNHAAYRARMAAPSAEQTSLPLKV